MLTVLSPAKKLLTPTGPYTHRTSEPRLRDKALQIAELMKTKTSADLASLMDLSKDLADLNYARYQEFHTDNCPIEKSYPALFLFQGDVYQGLQAKTWDERAIEFSQSHLGILSGLYGLLKPLDRIQAYRLEMGVRLANRLGNTLYEFWKEAITHEINLQLQTQANPVLINLASTEYFKAVDIKKLAYPVVTVNFYENTEFKMVGIHAKKARGTMAKFIMQNQIDDLKSLRSFNELGYHFNEATSKEHNLDFIKNL